MKREKTAVEWLAEQLTFKNEFGCYISDNTDNVTDIVNQAKQMEKEQIEEAYSDGKSHGEDIASKFEWGVRVKEINSEQYYNEIYGKDENKVENND